MVKIVTHERQEVFALFKGLESYVFDCMCKGNLYLYVWKVLELRNFYASIFTVLAVA